MHSTDILAGFIECQSISREAIPPLVQLGSAKNAAVENKILDIIPTYSRMLLPDQQNLREHPAGLPAECEHG
jgi:hypothetical protein